MLDERAQEFPVMLKSAYSSPKVKTLARRLAIPFPHALGLCGLLWNFAAEHAPHGNVGKFTNEELAEVMCWPDDADRLIEAMVAVRLLDRCERGRLVVHDWFHHCPQYVKNKIACSRMDDQPGVGPGVNPGSDPGSTPPTDGGQPGVGPGVSLPLPVSLTCTHTLTHTHTKQAPNEEPEPAPAVPVRRKRTQRWVWSEERNFADTDADAVREAAATFTAIDVEHELREIHGYLMANPSKRPKLNWDRFMHLQLSRKHDRACSRRAWPDPTYVAPQHVRDCFNAIPNAFRTEPDVCLPLLEKAIGVLAERIGKPVEEAAAVMGSKIAKYATSEVGRSKYGGKLRTWLERGRYNESAEAWKSRGSNQW